ncbi:ninjurin-1 [Contarinia nasturtii]|uniref:ninjurin-1 n=1 Tax=Contarinia nasturtii TaxID=265458 RepID=UPI0012D4533F|nr:ninjurin-1 [Contarinia nasturtii]
MIESTDIVPIPTTHENDSATAESKSVEIPLDVMNAPENKSTSLDTTDQGCVKCKVTDISLSLSSEEDDTEHGIPLDMDKKSNRQYKGMMDIALLTANANQLRFLITYNSKEKTFIFSATLIILSLIIQVAVGIGTIYKRYVKKKGKKCKAEKVNSLVICGVFCLAFLNVLIVSFTA